MRNAVRWTLIAVMSISAAGTAPAQDLRDITVTESGGFSNTICGVEVPQPETLPPQGSGPIVYLISPCFERQGQVAFSPPADYRRDIQLRPSIPSQGLWMPFDKAAERVVLEDAQRLWTNHRLADLSVTIRDYRLANGTIGKLVTYNMIER